MDKAPRELLEEDIMSLVRLGRAEGPTLEYKSDLYERNDRGNRELLLDICSMANSVGGYIFIGISEQREDGQASGIPDPDASLGLEIANPEQVLGEYEARILDCIDERLATESHAVTLGSGRRVLVFRVPNSLSKPHRVSYQGHTYFPARRERQRYALTATEIKELVMRTASRIEIAEGKIHGALDQNPSSAQTPTLTIAVVPVFTRNFAVDFRLPRVVEAFELLDLTAQGHRIRVPSTHSVDGLTRTGPGRARTAVVLRHDGLLRVSVELQDGNVAGHTSFYPIHTDMYVRGIAGGCGGIYVAAGLSAPLLLGMSFRIPAQCSAIYENVPLPDIAEVRPFTKNYPPLTLDSFADRIDYQIRPICDLFHQSLGEPNSRAFDDEGRWRNLDIQRR